MRTIEGKNGRTICVETQKLAAEIQSVNEGAAHLETDPVLFSEGADTDCALNVISELSVRFVRDLRIYRDLLGRDIQRMGTSLETIQQEDRRAAGMFRNDH